MYKHFIFYFLFLNIILTACITPKLRQTNKCIITLKYTSPISDNTLEYKDRGNYRYFGLAEFGLMEVARPLPIDIIKEYKPLNSISYNDNLSKNYNNYIDIEYCNCYDPEYNFNYLLNELKKLNYYKFKFEHEPREIWYMNVVDTIKFNNISQRKHFTQYTLASYEEQKPNKLKRDTIRFKPIEYLWSYRDPFEIIRSSFREKKSGLKTYIQYDEYMSDPDYYYSFSIFWPEFHGIKKFKTFQQIFLDKYGVHIERKLGNKMRIIYDK